MAHVSKFTRATCGLMTRHYERYKDSEHSENVTYKNQDIDSERTHLNYNLAPDRDQLAYLKQRLEEVHCLKRDDVKVMCDWVLTAPKELPEEHQKEFFEVCYNHLANKYGENNVISAYVHMDENQPHMHFAFVPVSIDSKKNIEKVSAKEVLTRAHLKSFHPELQKVVNDWIKDKGYEIECNVLNGATEGGNKTVDELKHENLKKSLDNLNHKIQEATSKQAIALQETAQRREHIFNLENKEKALEAKIEALDSEVTSKESVNNLIRTIDTAAQKVDSLANRIIHGDFELKKPLFGKDNEVTLGSVRSVAWELGEELERLKPVVKTLTDTKKELTELTTNTQQHIEDRSQELVRQIQEQLLKDTRQAEKDRQKAREAKQRYEELKSEQESYILGTAEDKAQNLFNDFITKNFGRDPADRGARLEQFVGQFKVKGENLLEMFSRQEQERSAKLSREFDKTITETLRQAQNFEESFDDYDFER